MRTKNGVKRRLSEKDIDRLAAAQPDDDSAWEKATRVRRASRASLGIPADLAARAAFIARLHHKASVQQWLTEVIRERVELEEAAFIGVKHDLAAKAG